MGTRAVGRRSIGRGPAGAFHAICGVPPRGRRRPAFTPPSRVYTRPRRGQFRASGPQVPPHEKPLIEVLQEGRRLPVPKEVEPIWSGIREDLRRETPDLKFHIWLAPLEPAGLDGSTIYV